VCVRRASGRMQGGEAAGCSVCSVASAPDLGGVDLSSCYSRISVARVLTFQDYRIESAMAQQPSDPQNPRADHDHRIAPVPSRYMPYVPAKFPAQPASLRRTTPQIRVRTRTIRQVAVLEVAGRLSEVVEDLDRAIQLALADGPRGVVCDLSAVLADPVAVEVLATAGRHVRNWPGIPVAVACPDPLVRDALRVHPLGRHLITAESLFSAMTAVWAIPDQVVQSLVLAPHPTAPRASRDFVTRTLLDWRLSRVIPAASLVVSALVASSTTHAGTVIDLSVIWDRGALRLSVRDHGPALPGQTPSDPDLQRRGLTVVAALSRAFGVLPTNDGGEVLWAVLEAPRPSPLLGNHTGSSRPEQVNSPGTAQAV